MASNLLAVAGLLVDLGAVVRVDLSYSVNRSVHESVRSDFLVECKVTAAQLQAKVPTQEQGKVPLRMWTCPHRAMDNVNDSSN